MRPTQRERKGNSSTLVKLRANYDLNYEKTFLTFGLGSVLWAFEGLLSEGESECCRFSSKGLVSDTLEATWLLGAVWPDGLSPVLSSKVMERTARLVGCGRARGFGLRDGGCK